MKFRSTSAKEFTCPKMVSGPLVILGDKTNMCQISVHEKECLIYIQAIPLPHPRHTHSASYKHISANSENGAKGTHRSKKRQQSILELPWQLVKGKKATAK